jgi:hypothetical protein
MQQMERNKSSVRCIRHFLYLQLDLDGPGEWHSGSKDEHRESPGAPVYGVLAWKGKGQRGRIAARPTDCPSPTERLDRTTNSASIERDFLSHDRRGIGSPKGIRSSGPVVQGESESDMKSFCVAAIPVPQLPSPRTPRRSAASRWLR